MCSFSCGFRLILRHILTAGYCLQIASLDQIAKRREFTKKGPRMWHFLLSRVSTVSSLCKTKRNYNFWMGSSNMLDVRNLRK